MQAIRIHFTDNGEEFRMEEVPQPEPKADEVLIKTQAIGVNRADLYRRRTVPEGEQEPPIIPGLDVAGVVESVGANVTNWHPGDQAIALVRSAYAEYSVAASALTYRPPAGMSTTDAASLPCIFLTDWYAFQMAGLKPGETALIACGRERRWYGGYSACQCDGSPSSDQRRLRRACGARPAVGRRSRRELLHSERN